MTVRGETVLVLGGWGLVGRAVCHELMQDHPKRMVVCSLTKEEAEEAVRDLERERDQMNEADGEKIKTRFVAEWGDIFARLEFKDRNAREIKDNKDLEKIIDDTFNDLKKINLDRMFLYHMINKYKPAVVIDAINTATIVAYKDIYAATLDLRLKLEALEKAQAGSGDLDQAVRDIGHSIREHLSSIYLPRLIRHIQIMYLALKKVRTKFFVKIGTTGTGGMGLNIPYTHSEEKPSQKLLSKSAVAGAHSLLLFLMANTPDTAFTIEIKPAAAIAWKSIDHGTVKRGKTPIALYDNPPKKAFALGQYLSLDLPCAQAGDRIVDTGKALEAVYINTGENGLFSQGEFTAITTTGQMEYVTPEEIARNVRAELLGGNTGHDIITALKNSIMSSTYRAGFMRDMAIQRLNKLEKEHGESVAFEILGPPRLSKLLYEAYLLKQAYGTPEKIAAQTPADMAAKLEGLVTKNADLRQAIISIGVPILLSDGERLLRGPKIVSPPFRGDNQIPLTPRLVDQYCEEGWVDLRVANLAVWRQRIEKLTGLLDAVDWSKEGANTSSRFNRKNYLDESGKLNIGEIVGWIFNTEEGGSRMNFVPIKARPLKPLKQ
ncbi:MAG: short-chain dehydrogenase [Myxococcales bacterium]|nr:short-chain dehydrogenase [Myxococcales bacterium]